MKLKDINRVKFAESFRDSLVTRATKLAHAVGGELSLSIKSKEGTNAFDMALAVCSYAQGTDGVHNVSRNAIDDLCELAGYPEGLLVLEREKNYEPNSELQAVVVAAYARRALDDGKKVSVMDLAVLASTSYANVMMHLQRENLKGRDGMVHNKSAVEWLSKRRNKKLMESEA